MQTMIWQTEVAELMRVIAIVCVAAGLLFLFRCRETAFIGAGRWVLLSILAGFAALHSLVYLAGMAGVRLTAPHAELLSGASVLTIAIAQSWFLLHVR
jgi:hypothetical protein